MINEDTINYNRLFIEKSEPGFVQVLYYEIDDGLDLGSRLYIEQASVPTFIEMLSQCLSAYGRRCGDDSFQIYDSGHKPQSFYNIDNRRPDGEQYSGLSGFTINRSDAEYLLKQLSDIAAKTSPDITATTSADTTAKTSPEAIGEMLNRQLLEAAANGDLSTLGKALTSGADVNAPGQHKQSALNIAAEKGHLYAVAILLTAGADIESLDVADRSPLMNAAFHGKTQVAYLLLRYGAVINRDLLSSLKLKVDIFEESVGGAGMVDSDYAAAWRKFYDSMIEKWHQQNETASP
ncbi:MAG: ankyrin repeat domain-containing protein [Pyrinomonadaceae bacterium]|nr:ankyrin repeat domain-containing protein [Pyrinomonadaceae bacterium]